MPEGVLVLAIDPMQNCPKKLHKVIGINIVTMANQLTKIIAATKAHCSFNVPFLHNITEKEKTNLQQFLVEFGMGGNCGYDFVLYIYIL